MARDQIFYVPPQNYYAGYGKKWQVTGFKIENNNPHCEFIDHSTGLAKHLFSGVAVSGDYIHNGGLNDVNDATGIYSASGQYTGPDLNISWSVAHPFSNSKVTESDYLYKYISHFEINLYDGTGKFATGYNFIDNGSINSAKLTVAGSGYIDPYVQINGDGVGAKIDVLTLGTGTHAKDQSYVVIQGDTDNNVLSLPGSGESGIGYLTGINVARIVSGGRGYTREKTSLQVLDYSGSGQGAKIELTPFSFGRKGRYKGPTVFNISPEFNAKAFFGFRRDYQVEVVAEDFFGNRTTGRMFVNAPKPTIGSVDLLNNDQEIEFGFQSLEIPSDKEFLYEDVSLTRIDVHSSIRSDFKIKKERYFDTFVKGVAVEKSAGSQGVPDNLSSLGGVKINQLDLGGERFVGQYYKFLPFDSVGSGDPVSFSSGIRITKESSKPQIPSGLRMVHDPAKGVGTNIQGDTIAHSYLTWKKDSTFKTKSYEIEIQDSEENQSFYQSIDAPDLSGIAYMVSGTGDQNALIDQEIHQPHDTENLPREIFDIFSAYGAGGIQWSAHTIYLDEEYTPSVSNNFINVDQLIIPAGNTPSGFLYFTGASNYSTSYRADDRLLDDETHLLVARRFGSDALTEYEPTVKIPTKRNSKYSFRVRAISNPKSNFSPKFVWTANADKSHFAFTPGTSQLRLGGTGDITVSGDFATTVGGSGIIAVGSGVVVVGGLDNHVTGEFGALVGGSGNRLIGNVGDPQEGHFLEVGR